MKINLELTDEEFDILHRALVARVTEQRYHAPSTTLLKKAKDALDKCNDAESLISPIPYIRDRRKELIQKREDFYKRTDQEILEEFDLIDEKELIDEIM